MGFKNNRKMKYIKLFESQYISEEDIIKYLKILIDKDTIRMTTKDYLENPIRISPSISLDNLSNDDIIQLESELDPYEALKILQKHVLYTHLNPILKNLQKYVNREIKNYISEILTKYLEKNPDSYTIYKDFFNEYDIPQYLKRADKSGLMNLEK